MPSWFQTKPSKRVRTGPTCMLLSLTGRWNRGLLSPAPGSIKTLWWRRDYRSAKLWSSRASCGWPPAVTSRSREIRRARPGVERAVKEVRSEHLRDLHPAPDCHKPPDARHCLVWGRRVPRSSGERYADRRFPDHLGFRQPARRKSRNYGIGRGDAAGAAVHGDRRTGFDDLLEFDGILPDHFAV